MSRAQSGNKDEKKKAVDLTVASIEKQFGKGSIMRLDRAPEPIEATRTGSIGLDLALGCGGYPRGRVVEIFGPEASGKTTLTLHAIAEMQRTGGTAAFIDAEHAFDPTYARAIGVNVEDIILSQPDNGEQGLDIVEMLVRSSAVDLVVVDSVAALAPKDEIEGEMGDLQVGLQARMMSKAMRKLTAAVARSNTTLIFINQIRQKIGVTFGPTEVTTGGNALKYYASVRLDIRRISALKKDTEVVGNRTKVKVVKNKLAAPFREVEFDIVYGRGIHRVAELIDLGDAAGAIERAGSWYTFGDQRLGNGRQAAIDTIAADPVLASRIHAMILPTTLRGAPAEA